MILFRYRLCSTKLSWYLYTSHEIHKLDQSKYPRCMQLWTLDSTINSDRVICHFSIPFHFLTSWNFLYSYYQIKSNYKCYHPSSWYIFLNVEIFIKIFLCKGKMIRLKIYKDYHSFYFKFNKKYKKKHFELWCCFKEIWAYIKN